MLLKEFLNPMEINQCDLAHSIHVLYQRINEIMDGRPGVTPSTALRLVKYLGTAYWADEGNHESDFDC